VARPVNHRAAYFNDAQRTATRDAGRLAGLEVLRIHQRADGGVPGLWPRQAPRGIIAVYDLGGGTFDISILKVQEGVFQVLATKATAPRRRRTSPPAGADGGRDVGLDPATEADAVQAVRKRVIRRSGICREFDEAQIEVAALPGRAGRTAAAHEARV